MALWEFVEKRQVSSFTGTITVSRVSRLSNLRVGIRVSLVLVIGWG